MEYAPNLTVKFKSYLDPVIILSTATIEYRIRTTVPDS
jgi:hypothetical protein